MVAVATLPRVPRSEHAPKLIRFPPDIARKIEQLAAKKRRTFTAQVLLMLERDLQAHPPSDDPDED